LTYPTFTIEINDSFDGIVSGHMADPFHQVHFNAHQAGCVSAVSDNTCHHTMRHPSCIRPSRPKNASKKVTLSDDIPTSFFPTDDILAHDSVDDSALPPEHIAFSDTSLNCEST
jgi:hypothetical protein